MWAAASRGEGGARWRKPGRGEGGGADLGWSASEGGPAMEGLSPAGLMRIWVMGSPGLEEAAVNKEEKKEIMIRLGLVD